MSAELEAAAAVIQPYFDAVRDLYGYHEPKPGQALKRLLKVRYVIDEATHDSERHFAGCRPDGMLILLAPESVELMEATLVAILAHEFGHAADFAYPGCWLPERDRPAVWIRDMQTREARSWRKAWPRRTREQMELAADSIAYAVTGQRLGYCGPCALQCFGGPSRPRGLE